MADQKISAMPSAATLDGTEITPIVQTGVNKQVTTANYVAQVLNVNPVLPSQGGTGATSLTGYVYGNGTSAFTASTTVPFSAVTGTVPATQGGTGLITYTLGDTLYASATNTLAKLAGNTTTTQKFLTQTGTGSVSAAPIWKLLSPSDINTQYGSFHYNKTTTLASAINNSVTTIPVVSTTGFSSTGAIVIEFEIITYTGITATSFTGCTRGVAGSPAASHASGTIVGGAQVAASGAATLVQINTQDLSNGVTVNTTTQEFSVAVNGVYNVAFSITISSFHNAQSISYFWFKKNGVNVANSTFAIGVPARENATTPGVAIAAGNLLQSLATTDKLQIYWETDTGEASLITFPETGNFPAAPALNVTINQVS